MDLRIIIITSTTIGIAKSRGAGFFVGGTVLALNVG